MAKKYRSDPAAAVILLTILASIIFYLFSVPEVTRLDILGDISSYNNTWLSASPGDIPIDDISDDTKTISFPSIVLDNTLRSDPLLLSNQFSVSAGVYSSLPQALSFSIDNLGDVSD